MWAKKTLRLVGWGLTALLTQSRLYRAFKVKTILQNIKDLIEINSWSKVYLYLFLFNLIYLFFILFLMSSPGSVNVQGGFTWLGLPKEDSTCAWMSAGHEAIFF